MKLSINHLLSGIRLNEAIDPKTPKMVTMSSRKSQGTLAKIEISILILIKFQSITHRSIAL
jgi:hypothetical protein